MRVTDLFESESPALVAKALHKEFAAMAKEYGLVLKGGMGWPRVSQKGLWTGGGIAPGKQKVDSSVKDMKYEHRRNAFFIDAAAKIEELLDQGRDVLIGKGASADTKGAAHAMKGHVVRQLMQNIELSKPPGDSFGEKVECVVWFVPHPPGLAGMKTLTGMTYVNNVYAEKTPPSDGGALNFYAAWPAKEARVVEKNAKFIRDLKYNAWKTKDADPKTYAKIMDQVTALAVDVFKLAGHDLSHAPGRESYFTFSGGFPSKGSVPLPADQLAALIARAAANLKN